MVHRSVVLRNEEVGSEAFAELFLAIDVEYLHFGDQLIKKRYYTAENKARELHFKKVAI
jgi:hypothetical protein